jgi:hypothetical protein
MIQLTEEQVQAVAASGEMPPTVVDPTTQTTYVLIKSKSTASGGATVEALPFPA